MEGGESPVSVQDEKMVGQSGMIVKAGYLGFSPGELSLSWLTTAALLEKRK